MTSKAPYLKDSSGGPGAGPGPVQCAAPPKRT